MKKHLGGLAKFLNDETQKAAKQPEDAEQIVYIDIDEIEPNPNNFYGLRDIDSLAGLISVSRMVEPLTVCPKEDGKYLLISGHRRRAAVQKLLEDGGYDERRLPCIVRQRRKITVPQEDGEAIVFDESDVDMLHLIASNRGQREERTMDEKLSEVKFLEPFARAVFAQRKQEQGKGMVFRKFFAEEILDISSSKLQRIEAVGKMTENVKLAVKEGVIGETAAARLAGLSPDDQDRALEWLAANERKGTKQDVNDAVKAVLSQEDAMDDNADFQEQGDPPETDNGEDGFVNAETEYPQTEEEQKSDKHNDEPSDVSASSEVNKAANRHLQETVPSLMDIPDDFDNPQKEAEDWFFEERLAFYLSMEAQARKLSDEEPNQRKAAQWGIRASVARYHIAELTEGR